MAINKGYEILGTLVRACLLLENNIASVTMHDVVREMALWITTDFGKNKDQWIVQVGIGLHEIPEVENRNDVRKMSLMKNDIERIIDSPGYPQLTTLFLQENWKLVNISGEFFRSLTRLHLLDLSSNSNIMELPEEISKLVSLRYLNLSFTNIERLPIGLQELKMLIHLNLEYTSRLQSLHGISRLLNLQTFRLKSSKVKLDMDLMKELEFLEHLEYITIDISQSFTEEQWSYDSRVWRCIQEVNIRYLGKKSVRILVLPAAKMESIIDKEKEESCKIIPFRKLEHLVLDCLGGLWSIYWTSLPFPCLKKLIIVRCDGLRKLPLHSQSVAKIEDFTIEYNDEKWKEKIKWEDEATKLRFLPSLVPK